MNTSPVIVIGSGFGGLAAAIRLRAMGHDVTVVEAGSQPGGRARVFERDGFSFDAGPTVVTAPYLIDELFELVGRDRRDYVELMPVDPFYRVDFADGTSFDYVGDEERLLAQIEQIEPRDVDGYRRMVEHAKEIFDIGYLELADAPFNRLSDMLRIIPDLVSLRAYKSVHGMVSSYLKSDYLRQVFTFQPLLVGGNPFRTPAIYLLIHWLERKWGVWFAKGGSSSPAFCAHLFRSPEAFWQTLRRPFSTVVKLGGEPFSVVVVIPDLSSKTEGTGGGLLQTL